MIRRHKDGVVRGTLEARDDVAQMPSLRRFRDSPLKAQARKAEYGEDYKRAVLMLRNRSLVDPSLPLETVNRARSPAP